MTHVPAPVAAVCETFLAALPTRLLEGLYLRGGVGFGEWVAGESDVDFVATLTRRPTQADTEALKLAHEQVHAAHPDVAFDGAHLLACDLAANPGACPDVPAVLGHLFQEEATIHDATVMWHELAWHGVRVAGPLIDELDVWTSAERLREFTIDNLDTYWRANAEALTAMPTEGGQEATCCWCVLGVTRLHHLLVTGEMTTKSAAGRWGLTYYPQRFHRVLREALRIREGGGDEYLHDRDNRGLDTAELTTYVVAQGTSG